MMTPDERSTIEGTNGVGAGADALEERIRTLEERLRTLQGGQNQGQGQGQHRGREVESLFDDLLPAESRRHLRAAQRERLLALRSLVDAAIKRTEDRPAAEGQSQGQGRPRRPESVRID